MAKKSPSKKSLTPDLHERAYNFEPTWQGKPLEAFTLGRQALAAELAAQRMPLPRSASSEAYMPNVWAVLWLCTHTPDAWAEHRNEPTKLWQLVEDWAEDHCTRDLWPAAVQLVYGQREDKEAGLKEIMGLWDAAKLNLAVVRKAPGPERPDAGNALCQ